MTAGRSIISNSQDWRTPPKYVDAIRDFFGEIYLDPCSNKNSIVHAKTEYSLPETDGLQASWNFKTIYVNPPYGTDRIRKTSIKDWLKKCCEAHNEHKSEVIALVPVAVNTTHWKKYVFGCAESICFLADTRLKFLGGNDKGAPMACAIIYWGTRPDGFYRHFAKYGAVVGISDLKKKGWVSPDLRSKEKTRTRNPKLPT